MHGHGTGQLRRGIAAFLKDHPLVAKFLPGAAEPGRRRRDDRGAEGLMGRPPDGALSAAVHRRSPGGGRHRHRHLGLRVAAQGRRHATRACARSTARRRRRSTSTATRASSTASAAASAATSSSSSSCRRRSASRTRCASSRSASASRSRSWKRPSERRESAAEREALLKMHEVAAGVLSRAARVAGRRAHPRVPARRARARRRTRSTRCSLGFAPPARDGAAPAAAEAGLHAGAARPTSGLVSRRDDGSEVDRFRNRLMIPIARDTGIGDRVRRPRARQRISCRST